MRPPRPRLAAAGPLAALAGLAALAALSRLGAAPGGAPLALVNESRSLPRGLYLRVPGPVEPGSVVAVPAPSSARSYLASLGAPAEARLLKRVAAAGETLACGEAGAVRLAALSAPVRARDRRGAPLPAWRGCRRLAADELFLLGDSAASFDSRYFGPVPRRAALGPYRRVLAW